MKVGAPDAHVDAVLKVVRAVDVETVVQVLKVCVDHDLVRVGDVLLDGTQLGVRADLSLVIHPRNLKFFVLCLFLHFSFFCMSDMVGYPKPPPPIFLSI
jgi:hypothetical protein